MLISSVLWNYSLIYTFTISESSIFEIKLTVPKMMLSTFGSVFLTSSEFSVATITDARYGVTIEPIKQVPIQTSGDDKVLGTLELNK